MLLISKSVHGGVLWYPRIQQTCSSLPVMVRVEVGGVEGLLGAVLIGVGVRVDSRPQLGRQGEVSEAHHLIHGDAVSPVEVHQAVEGAEGLFPDAVLAAPLQHPEMFHPVTIAAEKEIERERERVTGGWTPVLSSSRLRSRDVLFLIPQPCSPEVCVQTQVSLGVRNVRVCLGNHHRRNGNKSQGQILNWSKQF